MKHTAYIATDRKGKSSFWLLGTEIVGIVIGSALVSSGKIPERLMALFCPAMCGETLMDVFSGTLILSVIFLTAAFLSGLFAFGQVTAVGLITAAGAGFGSSAAMIYAEKSFAALPAVLLLHLPKTLGLSAVIFLAVRETLRSSTAVLRGLTSGGQEGGTLKLYCVKFIVLLLISLLISAVDALLNYVFACLV